MEKERNTCCEPHSAGHHHHHDGAHHHHDCAHHHHDCGCHDGGHSCGCHHHHGEGGVKHALTRILLAAVLLVVAIGMEHTFTDLRMWQLLLVYLVPYLIVGYGTLREAAENILRGEVFDENFLMAIATLGALSIGFLPEAESQFPEAVAVMLLFQLGEMFEGIAEGRSRKSISDLMDIRPDTARVERDGQELTLNPAEVRVGETIVVKPGEKVPLDGVVVEGRSSLDTMALTGESMPRSIGAEDSIVSGCVNLSGLLRVRVTREFGESTATKILTLVEHASNSKSTSENFITRFARIYTPIVVFAALVLALLPPLFGEGAYTDTLHTWLYRALTFLVVSCPCALVISVPLTFFGGIGGASRKGILVKGSNYLEAMARLDMVVFDKTGTLTEGVFEVAAIHPVGMTEQELLRMASHVERHSTHPIAQSLCRAYSGELEDGCVTEGVEEVAGHGMKAIVGGHHVCVGNVRMMIAEGVLTQADINRMEDHLVTHVGTIIHVAQDGQYAGHIEIADRIKEDARDAISDLKRAGVQKTIMLTGDHRRVGEYVAHELGLDEYHAELLPIDKVSRIEGLLQEKTEGRMLAFVGDGINDAPVLARADVGIAMGALGSDAAIEAADVVLMDDKPSKIGLAIRIAQRTLRIARENVWFSIGIKILVLLLATFGFANMWMAVFADVGVTLLAVLNAMRTLR